MIRASFCFCLISLVRMISDLYCQFVRAMLNSSSSSAFSFTWDVINVCMMLDLKSCPTNLNPLSTISFTNLFWIVSGSV